jgi:hypothetical protein
VEEYGDSHHFAEGQAAVGKPRPAGSGRQQMVFAIALKFGTEVVDITKNPGYTVVIHKNPSRFLYNEFLVSHYTIFGQGFLLSVELTLFRHKP